MKSCCTVCPDLLCSDLCKCSQGLTCWGAFQVCLFGASEVSLKTAMRENASDDDLRCIISTAVDRKKAAHAGMFALSQTKNRTMIQIGG